MNRIIEATEGVVDTIIEFRIRHAEKTGEGHSQVKQEFERMEERIVYYQKEP